MLVAALLTVWVNTADVLVALLASPLYTAVTECDPAASVDTASAADPLLIVAVPSTVVPSRNCTVPVAEFGDSNALKVGELVMAMGAPHGFEGIATLSSAHADVDIHVAAVDRELNERGYIVPGLGDAGDRQFGTFAGPASEPGHAHDETAEIVRRLQRNLQNP